MGFLHRPHRPAPHFFMGTILSAPSTVRYCIRADHMCYSMSLAYDSILRFAALLAGSPCPVTTARRSRPLTVRFADAASDRAHSSSQVAGLSRGACRQPWGSRTASNVTAQLAQWTAHRTLHDAMLAIRRATRVASVGPSSTRQAAAHPPSHPSAVTASHAMRTAVRPTASVYPQP